MLHAAWKRLSARLGARMGRAIGDERGAVAVQFAFLALPIAILTFGLVDVSRISVQRRQLQDALDAATLMAARSTATTDAALDTTGDAALAAEMTGLGVTLTTANSTFVAGTGNKVIGTVSVSMKPIIANLWTKNDVVVTAKSEVIRSVNKLEVVLVLDNTGSMGSNLGSGGKKIDALIDASQGLVDVLAAAAARASDTDAVKIAVVPFSMTVNVGSTYQNANWITGMLPTAYGDDVFDTNTNRFALLNKMKLQWTGCVESRPDPYDISDTEPTNSNKATMFVPYFAPDEPDANKVVSGSNWWGTTYYSASNNYITDDKIASLLWFVRQGNVQKYGTSNLTSSADNYDGGPNEGCGITDVMRLTNVRTSANANLVKAKLDDMVATGQTNVAMGAIWGWHAVSPNAPFADGKAYGTKNVSKIMVLLTDGDNVMSESNNPNDSNYGGYGYVWQKRLRNSSNVALDVGSSETQRRDAIDSRQSKVCTNAKAKGVIIYSIGVGVSNHSKGVLQACATSTDKYYNVTDASQLTEVFNTIAGSIQNLRIAK